MANLAKENAEWYEAYERLVGFAMALFRHVDDEARSFGDEGRTVLERNGGAHGNFGGTFTLRGVRIGTWTTERGEVIVRVTGVGPYTVTVYRATGANAGDRLCAGTGAAGDLVALTELNSSEVTGSYELAGSVTADTDDTNRWALKQDWQLLARTRFPGDDAEGEDTKALQAVLRRLDVMRGLHGQLVEQAAGIFSDLFVGSQENPRGYLSKFLRETFTTILAESTSVDGSGRVTRVRTGGWPAFVQAMADEATGSTQTFLERAVDASTGTADVNNDGQGTIAAHTPEDHCPTGRYTLTLVNGKEQDFPNDESMEQFQLAWASDVDDRTKVHSELVTVGQAYKGEDGFGGPTFQIVRSLTKTDDDSHLHLATIAGAVVTGEKMANTNRGVLYVLVVEVTVTTWRFEVYKSDTLDADSLVAQSSAVAAGAAFTASQVQASGLALVHTAGSAPVDGTVVTIDLNFFSSQNSANRPDSFYVDVTKSAEGETARVAARIPLLRGIGFKLNGVSSGELVDDDLVKSNGGADRYGDA